MALVLAQARAAVAAVLDEKPARYEHDWHTVTRRYRLMTAALLTATRRKTVRRLLVPTAERLPGVFSVAVNSLAEPV